MFTKTLIAAAAVLAIAAVASADRLCGPCADQWRGPELAAEPTSGGPETAGRAASAGGTQPIVF